MVTTAPRLLIVSGHDPSGAGVDADREALAGLAVDARFVVTAWTRQDASGLHEIGARGAGSWIPEARRALPAAALKFGLLPGREDLQAASYLVREARARAGARGVVWVVVDPVLSSSNGGRFLDTTVAREYVRSLVPSRVVLTPNLAELAELAGVDLALLVRDPAARVAAARVLLELGAAALVVKGGHGAEDPARDLVLEAGKHETWLEHARVPGGKVRGSGCRFASRMAARLALGAGLATAAQDASEHVFGRLRAAAAGA
jgi:hydroxymethylpyrimidine/phosphomethylpyrimidine kinase